MTFLEVSVFGFIAVSALVFLRGIVRHTKQLREDRISQINNDAVDLGHICPCIRCQIKRGENVR